MNYEDYLTVTTNGLDIEANNIEANCITSRNNNFNLDSDGNLTVNSITVMQASLIDFDSIYPIGSIYMSVNTTNPSILFGGAWQKIEGQFLLGSSNAYPLNSQGGEAEHVLTINEMPQHNHNKEKGMARQVELNYGYDVVHFSGDMYDANFKVNVTTADIGGNQPHNNMPPYLVVNIWKRVS